MVWYVHFATGELLAKDGVSLTEFIDDTKMFESYDSAFDALGNNDVKKLAIDHSSGPTVGKIKTT